jgi:hypothetical protein
LKLPYNFVSKKPLGALVAEGFDLQHTVDRDAVFSIKWPSRELPWIQSLGTPPMPLTAGDRLGPYEVLAPIGAGDMIVNWTALLKKQAASR